MANTQIRFSPISSSGTDRGTRDCAIDLTDALETSETIDTVEMTSSDPSVLTVTGADKNTVAITPPNGSTIAIGKGVQFQIAVQSEVKERDLLADMVVAGDSGTRETYEIMFPVQDKLRA